MNQDEELFVEYFGERFGVRKKLWDSFEILVGKRTVYIRAAEEKFPRGWEVENAGFRVARLTSNLFKPGNRLLQWLGEEVKRSIVEINAEEFKKILERKLVVPSLSPGCSRGFVALKFRGKVAGCGFWTGEELQTQISKGLSSQLTEKAIERA